MPGIRENSPAENAIFTLQISFEIEQWNLRNRLRTLHVTDGLFRALGVPRRFAACAWSSVPQASLTLALRMPGGRNSSANPHPLSYFFMLSLHSSYTKFK